jgi:hypothetical protein
LSSWDSQNQELLQYFIDGRAWRIDGDDPAPKLEAYGHSGSCELNPDIVVDASRGIPNGDSQQSG